MLKAAAMERAEALHGYGKALRLQGYAADAPLARAVQGLGEALEAVRRFGEGRDSKALGEALHGLGQAFDAAGAETGLGGFLALRNEAATLSLLFTGFAMQGEAQRKRKARA